MKVFVFENAGKVLINTCICILQNLYIICRSSEGVIYISQGVDKNINLSSIGQCSAAAKLQTPGYVSLKFMSLARGYLSGGAITDS